MTIDFNDDTTFVQRQRDGQVIVFQTHAEAVAFMDSDDNRRDVFKFVDVTFHFNIHI